jgi:hypothetical protein
MDNPEKLETLGTQDTKRRQIKQTHNTENKKDDHHLFCFLCCVFGGVRVGHLFCFLCCVFGGVRVGHLFCLLCCVFGGVRVGHLLRTPPKTQHSKQKR